MRARTSSNAKISSKALRQTVSSSTICCEAGGRVRAWRKARRSLKITGAAFRKRELAECGVEHTQAKMAM